MDRACGFGPNKTVVALLLVHTETAFTANASAIRAYSYIRFLLWCFGSAMTRAVVALATVSDSAT